MKRPHVAERNRDVPADVRLCPGCMTTIEPGRFACRSCMRRAPRPLRNAFAAAVDEVLFWQGVGHAGQEANASMRLMAIEDQFRTFWS